MATDACNRSYQSIQVSCTLDRLDFGSSEFDVDEAVAEGGGASKSSIGGSSISKNNSQGEVGELLHKGKTKEK